jgi:hypothetical protein
MKPIRDSRPRARWAWRLPLAAALVALCAGDAMAQFVMRQYTTSNIGANSVRTPCFELSSTAGEAVPDTASAAGPYLLHAGFLGAGPVNPRNNIFRDEFEDCSR